MKRIFLIVWLVLFAVEGNAQSVVTNSNVNLRSAPNIDGEIVYQISKGTAVDLNGCQSKWCEVTVASHSGYIAKQYTGSTKNYHSIERTQQTHAIGPVNHYTNSKGNIIQSPTHYDAVPAGATAQCRDGSYSFSQSRRGTCSHHGGVAKWLQ